MTDIKQQKSTCFTYFKEPIDLIERAERFTFPFYYDPHPLAILAVNQLQDYLKRQSDYVHDFGIENPDAVGAVGKMFGVLVVENAGGELGFLAAFSGHVLAKERLGRFVPAVFDSMPGGEFYTIGEAELNEMTKEIERLESNPKIAELREMVKKETAIIDQKIEAVREETRAAKIARRAKRKAGKANLEAVEYAALEKELARESVGRKYYLKDTERQLKESLLEKSEPLKILEEAIANLKAQRKAKSIHLQQQLFQHYRFFNIKGAQKDLTELFQDIPKPSGAGECAAPKLLQYAFQHNLQPIAMAEFWWGKSPASAVRHHKQYYPACTGKCRPILAHMLDGMLVDENPMLTNPALGKELPILLEDDQIVVVNKPADFLSVPGKNIYDSVQTRMQTKYPEVTNSMTIHRLDMSTSGILILAKSKESHKFLQNQFAKRTIKKRYVAVLDGIVKEDVGRIELPLRVDLDNRPHQVICYEYGKPAVTEWEVIERTKHQTRVYFYPITGRTHQLRVHAAHSLGLGCPIVGDDLYGRKANRLHLHAQRLEFEHPVSRERMVIEAECDF